MPETESTPADANSYLPFKSMNTTTTKRITEEIEHIIEDEEEGKWSTSFMNSGAMADMTLQRAGVRENQSRELNFLSSSTE